MPGTIVALEVEDIRFPTSRELDGSDAMNTDPDYSAAYVVLRTDRGDGLEGHGLTFTTGRGTELCVAAVEALAPHVVGRSIDGILGDLGGFWRSLVGDTQLRWVGPEKGVIHLATAAIVNAVWDLYAKLEGKPLWRLLVDLPPAEIVGAIDFRYLSDALPPSLALEYLERLAPTKADRIEAVLRAGLPAYTTSVGWLGYSDEKIRRLCREALAAGFIAFKQKVGADLEDDIRRAAIIREEIGPGNRLMMDANQRWDVAQAINWMGALARFDPYWIEEPTSPDDVLGHAAIARGVAPILVATGEHVQNRVMFKQFLAAGGMQVCQIDACRLGGVNEVLAVLLLARRFEVPVCPHAGGVGLCELVQHHAIFDYVAVSGTLDGRMVEYVDHLHEHFLDPVVVRDGRYIAPSMPGFSAEMKAESRAAHRFPDGAVWQARAAVVA
ncbi:MAG: L-fuconate dehydratase [Candidatus Limnocylindrales bacterium]